MSKPFAAIDPYEIAVVEHDSERTVKRFTAASERPAEKLERGININLDHRFYYTEIRRTPAFTPQQRQQDTTP